MSERNYGHYFLMNLLLWIVIAVSEECMSIGADEADFGRLWISDHLRDNHMEILSGSGTNDR